jgi:hypothetical protein
VTVVLPYLAHDHWIDFGPTTGMDRPVANSIPNNKGRNVYVVRSVIVFSSVVRYAFVRRVRSSALNPTIARSSASRARFCFHMFHGQLGSSTVSIA